MCADRAQFSVVLIICTVALLCMCGFLLYGTIDQDVDSVGAIVFVIVVEIWPLVLLIFTVYSKRANVFAVWYSRARSHLSASRSATDASATRSLSHEAEEESIHSASGVSS